MEFGYGMIRAQYTSRVDLYWAAQAFVSCSTNGAYVVNITSSPRGNPRSIADMLRQFEVAGQLSFLTCWTSDFKEDIMQSSNLYTIVELSTWVLCRSFSLPWKE